MKTYKAEMTAEETERSKRGRRNRRSGHQFERDMVNRFKAMLPDNVIAWRGLQSKGGGCNPDVSIRYEDTKEPILHCECKKGKAPNPRKAFQQALDEHNPGTTPVAITQADRDHILVTMRWDDWTDMFTAYVENLMGVEKRNE